MKTICILALGTRGDIQPYIPLAKGLMDTGNNVYLCTSHEFEDFVTEQGVPFRPIHAAYLSLATSEEGKAMMAGNVFAVMKNMKSLITPMIRQSLLDMADVCRDADAIICHPKAFGAYDIAEAKQIPVVTAAPTPVVEAVRVFANPAFFSKNLGSFFNEKSYSLNAMGTASFTGSIKEWRKNVLGLPAKRPRRIDIKVNGKLTPVLYGISPSVLPDVVETDRFCLSGYWFMDEPDFSPDDELAAFMEDEKVVCIGFGSMSVQDPDEFNKMVLFAAGNMKHKVIILSGWNGFDQASMLPDNVLVRKSIPHSWLFPKVSAVVHHGGAGTTAACLRAGVPMVICPLLGDQPFWAARMHSLGVLSESIPIRRLTDTKLTNMVQQTLEHTGLTDNANAISQRISQEDGVGTAVRFLSTHLNLGLLMEMM